MHISNLACHMLTFHLWGKCGPGRVEQGFAETFHELVYLQ
jgi:hypothetical protein